jgi:hypothetical protein
MVGWYHNKYGTAKWCSDAFTITDHLQWYWEKSRTSLPTLSRLRFS